jgi:TolB protein
MKLLAFLMVSLLAGMLPARAEMHLDITQPNVAPMPIAITDFYGAPGQEADVGKQIAQVVSADLASSGLFAPIDPAAFVQTPDALRQGPRFADWKVLNAQALVSGTVATEGDGRLRVEFRLWDVLGEAQMAGMAYTTQPTNARRIAHIIADTIYQRITGETGYFDTRIVYVAESGPYQKRTKRLAIMDQDGFNMRYLTDGSNLVLTPRFSPTVAEITYMAYINNHPRVYLQNIDTGRRELLIDLPGMSFAPRFSPDGNKVILSLAQNGASNIYVMDLRTRQSRQLTNDPSINTAPCYSPDGTKIAFESDRSGGQQLYTMNADGSGVKRISFGAGKATYANPVWSPRGDLIAFTKISGGTFYIGVIKPDGSGEREITEGYDVEGPTWAPNGRVLAYFKEDPSGPGGRDRTAKLYSIDITGQNERQLPTQGDASDPAWSPLIP